MWPLGFITTNHQPMIKFFRKIRQDLLMENKSGKYFKYAIGEIVLVVIGILIALQINNWNENRKAKVKERVLYSRMIMDLKTDENRINTHIDYYSKDLEFLNKVYLNTQGLSIEDSIMDFSSLRASRVFNLVIRANYSNNIKEISREKISQSFNQYFVLEHHVHNAFEIIWDFKEDHFKPYLAENGMNDTKELFNNRHLSYFELREKNVFSHSKLKEQYGTVKLDQMLFDLGVRTAWAKTALENLLPANKKLQLDLETALNNSF